MPSENYSHPRVIFNATGSFKHPRVWFMPQPNENTPGCDSCHNATKLPGWWNFNTPGCFESWNCWRDSNQTSTSQSLNGHFKTDGNKKKNMQKDCSLAFLKKLVVFNFNNATDHWTTQNGGPKTTQNPRKMANGGQITQNMPKWHNLKHKSKKQRKKSVALIAK